MRRAFVCFVMALAGCSLVVPFDDLRDPDALRDSSPDAASQTDGGDTDGAGPVDAGDVDANALPCGERPGVLFCDEFESVGSLTLDWKRYLNGGTLDVLEGPSKSGTRSARATIENADGGPAYAAFATKEILTEQRRLRYEWEVLVEQVGPGSIAISRFRLGRTEVLVFLHPDRMRYTASDVVDGTQMTSLPGPAVAWLNEWHHIAVTIDARALPFRVQIELDGVKVRDDEVLPTTPPHGKVEIMTGVYFGREGPWALRFDNVVLRTVE